MQPNDSGNAADAVAAITTRWLRYAMEDLTEAESMVSRSQYAPHHACFLAQQGAEKALKAVLVFLQLDAPRSHNLNALRNLNPVRLAVDPAVSRPD